MNTCIKTIVLIMVISVSSRVSFAGAVDWNSFKLEETGTGNHYYFSWISPMDGKCAADSMFAEIWIGAGSVSGPYYLICEKRGVGLGDDFVGNLLQNSAGDVVDYSSSRMQGDYVLHDKLDNEPYSENWIEVEEGRNYYLAVVAGNFNDYQKGGPYDNVAYGWVNIGVGEGGTLSVLSSAMGLEGQAMVVGAIPEPTSAMFILLGVAGLALRRKSHFSLEQGRGTTRI